MAWARAPGRDWPGSIDLRHNLIIAAPDAKWYVEPTIQLGYKYTGILFKNTSSVEAQSNPSNAAFCVTKLCHLNMS